MAFSCYTYPNPIFQPAVRTITAITNSNPATVTTSIPHLYKTGTIVRIDIMPPIGNNPGVGMPQINQQFAPIVVTGSTTFTIAIDTTNYQPYAIPSPVPSGYTCSQTVPIGEVNEILTAAVQNTLP